MSGRHRVSAPSARTTPCVEMLEARQLLSTYYVSPSGSDSSAGTSTSAPWKSINRVNSQTLKAGDKVLFQGGQTFGGSLYIPSKEGGTGSNPVTFSTYGSGSATISSGTKSGFDIAQTAGISISNLKFVGSGMNSNSVVGIWVHTDWANRVLSGLTLKNVEVSGYGREGMRILMSGSGSSLSNVKVEQSSFHDNLYGGFKFTGSAHNSNKNVTIDHVKAYNNYGSRANSGVTGSGIYIADVDGAMINRCISYSNGKDGHASVGIWAAGSNRVTIQYCESYNNDTAAVSDGGGFDFDWDTNNSIMQYNYSHGNAGPGFLLGAGTHGNSGNVIRYNVSENDGRKNGRASIHLWGNITNASIYNNTVYMTKTGNSNSSTFYAHDLGAGGKVPMNVEVRNNIFYTTDGIKLLNLTSGVAGRSNMKFSGNAYYSSNGAFKIQWGGSSYGSLNDWRNAKGQEKLNNVATGYQGDPKLTAAGKGGTIGNADLLKNLSAYKLQTTSPLINKGMQPPSFLSASVGTDFYGDLLPKGGKWDIGVDEVA